MSLITLSSFAQNKVTYIKMQRTACFGACPEYTVELFKNGEIVYLGKKHVDRIGKFEGKISPSTMNQFLKSIAKYKLSNISPNYKSKVMDIPRLNFTFIVNAKTKSTKNAESGPAYLSLIGKQVDSLLETVKWMEAPLNQDEEAHGPVLNIEVDHDKSYVVSEKKAIFPGGEEAMMEFIRRNLRYPAAARENGIEGKVICGFVVNKEGKVTDIKIMKSLESTCDEEAMRVIKMMPDWQPAIQGGKAVNMQFNIPINFKLK